MVQPPRLVNNNTSSSSANKSDLTNRQFVNLNLINEANWEEFKNLFEDLLDP